MPEYLPPGVYVEDLPPDHSIEGIATSTAGFLGPTHEGPAARASDVLTTFAEFESEYGAGRELEFADGSRTPNYLWHAARAFFENGGKRLHVVRTWRDDGLRPGAVEYTAALEQLERVSEVALVSAAGATFGYEQGYGREADAITQALLAHAERLRRFAVIDAGDSQSVSEVREMRARFDSSHGALYYPWVRIADPMSGGDLHLPPSGFVAGIYARVDTARGVDKAPANEIVNLATGLERDVSREQDVLNPEAINCLRAIPGRGIVVFGARTLSADPEWKYVNVRRYILYLEASIDRGTQWAVSEPNGESLWSAVRQAIENFLFSEWKSGALLGRKPDDAFFVKCDRTTMTQNDLDNGRLICLVGVAPLRPAEFVVFRIGQWTRDRKP